MQAALPEVVYVDSDEDQFPSPPLTDAVDSGHEHLFLGDEHENVLDGDDGSEWPVTVAYLSNQQQEGRSAEIPRLQSLRDLQHDQVVRIPESPLNGNDVVVVDLSDDDESNSDVRSVSQPAINVNPGSGTTTLDQTIRPVYPRVQPKILPKDASIVPRDQPQVFQNHQLQPLDGSYNDFSTFQNDLSSFESSHNDLSAFQNSHNDLSTFQNSHNDFETLPNQVHIQGQNGIQGQERIQAPKSPLPMEVDSDSEDEIAVLSKEEAERSGTFKQSSFELNSRYNQPVPVFHAGGATPAELAHRQEDQRVRAYFERYSVPQIQQHEQNLNNQLVQLDLQRDGFLKRISSLREKVLNLLYDQVSLRSELMKSISSTLKEADETIKRSKRVRRFQGILKSVKDFKMYPQMATPNNEPHFDYHFQPPHGTNAQMPGSFPQSYGTSAQMPGSFQQSYGTNVNPYVTAETEETVHLKQLFNDIYKEEEVEGMAPTPESLTVQLLDHQRKGLHWLLRREEQVAGALLADDMGLGKTVQTIALIMANRPTEDDCKTTLIVGPVSLLRQWAAEIKAKVNAENRLSVAFFHGPDRKKLSTFRRLSRFDIVMTSYTTLASEYKQHYAAVIESAQVTLGQNLIPDQDSGGQTYLSPFFSPDAKFFRIVLDEAQYIKNKISQSSKATALLKGKHRLCLTGTPMQNSIDELYPIIRFLKVKPYDDEKKFKRDIAVPMKAKGDSSVDYDGERVVSMKKLRAVLLAIMLRRTKDSKVDGKPLIELPKKSVNPVYVKMGEEEKEYYKDLEGSIQKRALRLLNLDSVKHSDILTLLLRLRQACIHEYLVLVGEMNSQENSGGSDNIVDWKQRYRVVSRMTDELRKKVEWGVGKGIKMDAPKTEDDTDDTNEVQFTCPLCFDVVGENSIVIFGTCGHMICDGCVDNFFDQYRVEASEYGNREASCNFCSAKVANSSLVDYYFYLLMVNDGFNFNRLGDLFGNERKTKTLNSEKVAKIIRDKHGFKESAKMRKTVDLINLVTSETTDEKIIVFSHFTTTFDLMKHALKEHNIPFLRYDGTMNIDAKNAVIGEFYQGLKRVLLISLKAGNVGLTLTCASHVILMDPFWNPYVEDQAMDRAHRFGQMKEVKVYKLLIHDSVEDRIMDLQERKKELISAALDESALKKSSYLGRHELGYLFGLNSLDRAI